MHCGIEFEYLLIDLDGATPARIRDFSNLPFAQISAWLEDKPGRDDAELAAGDLGIKRGYWYLEGNERFHDDGRFRTLDVKGVEIRTPPAADVETALQRLLAIETELSAVLARHGLGLAIAAFNPVRAPYRYDPPLNAWEAALRAEHRAYDGSHISTLSYGPDINLSMPGWSNAQCLDAARKLQHYAPWIVPFSFASPFAHGRRWSGWSKRTHERAPLRPAVKLYLEEHTLAAPDLVSPLIRPARIAREVGRIEFKAFDAMPDVAVLRGCCHLLVGICLAHDLMARSETADVALYQRAARLGFADVRLRERTEHLLVSARAALLANGDAVGAQALTPLFAMVEARRTPALALVEQWESGGPMFRPGGFASPAAAQDSLEARSA
jgi:hypothetical protein